MDALLDSFRPGRERERDRTQLLSPTRQPETSTKADNAAPAYISAAVAANNAPPPATQSTPLPTSLSA